MTLAGEPLQLFTATRTGAWSHPLCGSGPNTVCLLEDRFEVSVDWRDFQGGSGAGVGRSLTRDSGAFWFFDDQNLELVVKVIDGGPVNGHWWVFFGSLTNVAFDLRVRDSQTGEERFYTNPSGTFASRGDTDAFPRAAPSFGGGGSRASTTAFRAPHPATITSEPLCFHGGRFCATVTWEDFTGGSGVGVPIPLTDDSGALWFFDPDNIELVVKVLDGHAVNDHWWVFFGSLTNVGFTLTVTDTFTDEVREYHNPPGRFASRGDTVAFR